jgi:hypothetical protein
LANPNFERATPTHGRLIKDKYYWKHSLGCYSASLHSLSNACEANTESVRDREWISCGAAWFLVLRLPHR